MFRAFPEDLSVFFCFFPPPRSVFSTIIFGDFGDGTRGQIARPAAAAGGGVGAERTEGHGGTDQARGETHTEMFGETRNF